MNIKGDVRTDGFKAGDVVELFLLADEGPAREFPRPGPTR